MNKNKISKMTLIENSNLNLKICSTEKATSVKVGEIVPFGFLDIQNMLKFLHL